MPADRVIVDTNTWSLLLRRGKKHLSASDRVKERRLRDLIIQGQAVLLGMVRLEILSGIEDGPVFDRLAEQLDGLDDLVPQIDDYVRAARFSNRCRSAGIAPSPVDMLICSMADGRDLKILSADKDFLFYRQILPIHLEGI